jgi:hypothetical protein
MVLAVKRVERCPSDRYGFRDSLQVLYTLKSAFI